MQHHTGLNTQLDEDWELYGLEDSNSIKSILDFNTSAFVYDDIFDEWKASSIDEYEQCEVFPVYPELFYIYIMKHLVNVVHNNSSILHKNFTQKFYTKTSYKNFYWVFKMWLKQITLHDFLNVDVSPSGMLQIIMFYMFKWF